MVNRFIALLTGNILLDLGGGKGIPLARYFIEHGYSMHAIDTAPQMIEQCQQHFPKQQWFVADMRHLNLKQRYARILAWDSFFHLTHDDQRAMFPIFLSMLKWVPHSYLLGPSYGQALSFLEGETLYHASLAAEEYQYLLAANGFQVIQMIVNDSSCTKHTVWLAQKHQ